MTRTTRDRYRHAVERIAKDGADLDESAVAGARRRRARLASAPGADARDAHVGYYLIGDGRVAFERACGLRVDCGRACASDRGASRAFYFGALARHARRDAAALPAAHFAPPPSQLRWLVVAILLAFFRRSTSRSRSSIRS